MRLNGEKLARARKAAMLSRSELAGLGGLSWNTIARLERDPTKRYRPESLLMYLKALGLTPEDAFRLGILQTDDAEPPPPPRRKNGRKK